MDAVCHNGRVGAPLLLAATLLLHPAALSAQPPDSRLPLPDSSTQDQRLELFREVFGKEYDEADSSEKKLALAAKLVQKAIETPDEPASRYVFLRIAKDLSVAAGDASRALEAVDAIAGTFDVDGFLLKADTLTKTLSEARGPAQCSALAHAAAFLAEEAVADDRYELAGQLADVAMAAARNSRDAVFLKRVVAWGKHVQAVQAAYAETVSARTTLGSDPTNPEANLAGGKFFAFAKGDWQKAIPFLALAGDGQLQELARRELQSLPSSTDPFQLAEQWWDLAETTEDPEAAGRIRAHAGEWYGKALPQLTGLTKAKAESRLGAATASGTPAVSVLLGGGLDQPIPGEIEDIQAAYGTDNKAIDVTEMVRKLYRQDPFAPIHACNALFGDPAGGRNKRLYLQYRFGRHLIRRTVREGGFETIPAIADQGMKLRDATEVFTVLAARYGARETWMDVSDTVARLVTDPTKPFPFGVAEAGRDPLPGVDKVLVVWFDYRGLRFVRVRSTRRPCTLLP